MQFFSLKSGRRRRLTQSNAQPRSLQKASESGFIVRFSEISGFKFRRQMVSREAQQRVLSNRLTNAQHVSRRNGLFNRVEGSVLEDRRLSQQDRSLILDGL